MGSARLRRVLVACRPGALKVIYNLDSRHNLSSNRFSAYVQDTYRLSTSAGYLNITGGIRFSYWDYNKETLVSPRVNLGFVPDAAPRWAFRFATGLYYQSPFYKEYRMPVVDENGNTRIAPIPISNRNGRSSS